MKASGGIIAAALGLLTMGALYGCASYPVMSIASAPAERSAAGQALDGAGRGPGRGGTEQIRANQSNPVTVPGLSSNRPEADPATPEQIAALVPDQPINATLPPQPLAQYLNTLFAEVLRVPYSLGPGLGARTEIITVNAPPATSRRAYVGLLQNTLRTYGMTLSAGPNGFQVTENGAGPTGASQTPVIRSRSSADTPAGNRQVIQLFQLVALRADAVQLAFEATFRGMNVQVTPDPAANALVLTGAGRNVATAVEFLFNLDQPAFAGAQVVRLEPVFWAPDAFAQALAATLQAEGYIVAADPLGEKSIMILPLAATNQTLVFAADEATMSRIQYWARELDQPSAAGDQSTTYVYEVRNTSASSIGVMLVNAGNQAGRAGIVAGGGFNPALGPAAQPQQAGRGGQNNQGRGGQGNQQGRGGQNQGRGGQQGVQQNFNQAQAGRAGQSIAGSVPTGGVITVDEASNRILFTGSPSQFAQLRGLLRQLDMPARQVLVEVTVAEVTLTDETRSGVEFFFDVLGDGGVYSGGTRARTGQNGLSLGNSGLSVGYINETALGTIDLEVAVNAFASNNKVNILSRPRLTARSGVPASIQVGSDVPIVIGQRAVNTGGNNNDADVTQQIQYRQTGVILNITPTIYGEDQVDIVIYQEVSDDRENPNPAIQSPLIDVRTIETTLSLADGQTAVLGGLMQDSFAKSNRGIPFLKDLPLIGLPFRSDTVSGAKTELVVLITPFIIRDAEDMAAMRNQMVGQINDSFRASRGGSYTLTPWSTGQSIGLNTPDPVVTGSSLARPAAP